MAHNIISHENVAHNIINHENVAHNIIRPISLLSCNLYQM